MTEPRIFDDPAIAALVELGESSRNPVMMHLLLADRCNHACGHCYQVQGLKGELTREQVERVLREFQAGGGFVVTFSGGEATLRDDLIPLLTYAHELGLATILYTNGYAMTEALAAAIAACGVWRVEISVYSHRAAEHDAVTRVAGSWQKTTDAIRWLRAMKANVTLKFTPTAQSTATAAQMVALAAELDAHLYAAEMVFAGEGGRLEPTKIRRAPRDAITVGFSPDHAQGEKNPLHGRPCGAGRQLSVRSDGMVQPCSLLNVSMGQIGSEATGLSKAWESDVARFFAEVTWADFPGCRVCDLRAHCSRCYASAASEVGDMLAPYRGACELAVARYREATGTLGVIAVADNESELDTEPAIGPYRLDAAGRLRPTKAQHGAYDRALMDRYPWLRQSREALQLSACGSAAEDRVDGLIQLRKKAASGTA